MKPIVFRIGLLVGGLALVALVAVLILTVPRAPVALIRVVDAAGKPIAGAVIRPEGLRTKPGPYRSGWYSWLPERNGVPNPPVTTDQNGSARVPYPKYVFERIETGTLCLSVNHPDYVPERPERIVATAPPTGAPWRDWAAYVWGRIRRKAIIVRPDPIVLQKGGVLLLRVQLEGGLPKGGRLFAQVSGGLTGDTNFWQRPEPGVILTRRLAPGPHEVRALEIATNGTIWFSDVVPVTAVAGQTNALELALKRGVTVRGQLDAAVPRPVRNGRVIVHVWPAGLQPKDSPPQWHAWSRVREDGSFAAGPLPAGDLEVVALCAGYVSTNGPGQFQVRYPQKAVLGTNDLDLTIGMEPTACLQVTVLDQQGKPLKGIKVMTWPNVRYGEWAATVLAGDCYCTADELLHAPANNTGPVWGVPDFQGVSDSEGVAVLPNVPADVTQFSAGNGKYELPAVQTPGGEKRRQGTVMLVAGQTNYITVQLEPHGTAPIKQY